MALFIFFHKTEADSAYDKGPIQYFDAYRLTNKGDASYQHFFDLIHIHICSKSSLIESEKILSGT